MIRTILSPGVELKEIDKSQYTPNFGTTPRALVMGFASKGPESNTSQITSMDDFRTIYGTPTNEVERYFYNATDIMLGSGATVVAAKIPYANSPKYVGIKYKVESATPSNLVVRDIDVSNLDELLEPRSASDTLPQSDITSDISVAKQYITNTDSSITKYFDVYSSDISSYSEAVLESLENGDRDAIATSSFVIIDKTKSAYKTFTGNGANIECLGILPVVTTAANAMAIADEISNVNMDSEISIGLVNAFEPIGKIDYITKYSSSEISVDDSEISSYWSTYANTIKDSNTLNSISKIASQFFPSVVYSGATATNQNNAEDGNGLVPFDHNYFSYIGVVVFKISVDRGNGLLIAEPVEAFAGSLLSNAKDIRTNGSVFIEDIINSTSNYISIYVNEGLSDQTDTNIKFDKNSMLFARPCHGVILGIPTSAFEKKIAFDTITKVIDRVTKSQSNILASTLDVVVDAGLSTIGECVNGTKETSTGDDKPIEADDLAIVKQKASEAYRNKGPWLGWRQIVNKFKKFCEQTRKDCVFVADSPRFLSLRNQRKLVNPRDANNTIADTILPNIKYLAGVNTSYGWGYTTWFKIADGSDGTAFWCPPSIFGANRYIATRTNWHTWDAPAGMTRGAISVDDTSFEPDLNARNTIYSNAWNYSLTDIQNGVTTLEGQKTFQSFPSAFDRINVRSLFLDVERQIFRIARNYIYEPNTADTRQQFVDNITPILNSIQAQGGCYAYKIICDESINTPQTIDNNELHVRIGIQPVKTIEFILIEMVATRTGSDWSELVME